MGDGVYLQTNRRPTLLYDILMGFLGDGEIDVRTAYGWVSSGRRQFGLGQGSVLSIRHIGYYMDVLMQRQDGGPDTVDIRHSQSPETCKIAATVLVDDVIDCLTTHAGIEHRVAVSNIFTGIKGTGGVFGAAKSFLMQYTPGQTPPNESVYLHDGTGEPKAVSVVSPSEGFKHLEIYQSTEDIWSATFAPVWQSVKVAAQKICRLRLTHDQLRYIVNHVWLPRIQYRTQLNSSHKIVKHVDAMIRRVARHTLRLPYCTPRVIFYDVNQGLGLAKFEDMCNVARVELVLRVMNSKHLPAFHLLMEAFEMYQTAAGLTHHPLQYAIDPPSHLQRWIHLTIRAVVALEVALDVDWNNPPACRSTRPNDRSIWKDIPLGVRGQLLRYNLKYPHKVRYVGDIANERGTRMLHPSTLESKHRWSRAQLREYKILENELKPVLCRDGSRELITPLGRTPIETSSLQVQTLDVAPGQFFIVSEFDIGDEGLEMRGYELGQRLGDIITPNPEGYGQEIQVQWWHEPRPESGIWTRRPNGIATELADVCVPVEVVSLPFRRGSRDQQRVIVRTDTTVAGDGSVLGAGTPEERGGWATHSGSIRKVGKVNVHWADTTSTRCECHALIAGLAGSGDSGVQVCDSQPAIATLEYARSIMNGTMSPHIKYNNPHRVEIRSMIAKMRPGGSFSAQWTRSHQGHEITSASNLVARRVALAVVDSEAVQSHAITMTESYADIIQWDLAHLVDSDGCPVVGKTRRYLTRAATEIRKRQWTLSQGSRGEDRITACVTNTNTARLLGWTDHQKRFYWRSISNVLHTNLQNHCIHRQWSPYCRTCVDRRIDSQEHRYGINGEPCVSSIRVFAEITKCGYLTRSIIYQAGGTPSQRTVDYQRDLGGHEMSKMSVRGGLWCRLMRGYGCTQSRWQSLSQGGGGHSTLTIFLHWSTAFADDDQQGAYFPSRYNAHYTCATLMHHTTCTTHVNKPGYGPQD
ncbi:hypothetical protein PHMEG_00012560 [Phytophthora megakarya]|uniref:Uncharacterized protein n=1 Tax=Phytophthora megakarya TaxID=4795 RepID=A0A225WA52_9STRA|nr:hypothetical protein PHMEG_00012560 [Phytophthora megakarya]